MVRSIPSGLKIIWVDTKVSNSSIQVSFLAKEILLVLLVDKNFLELEEVWEERSLF